MYTLKELYDDGFTIQYIEDKGVVVYRYTMPVFLLSIRPNQFEDEEHMFQVVTQAFGDWLGTITYEEAQVWWWGEQDEALKINYKILYHQYSPFP